MFEEAPYTDENSFQRPEALRYWSLSNEMSPMKRATKTRHQRGKNKQTNKQIPKASSMNQVLFPFQANSGTQMWFRTYMWGIIYLRYVFKYIFLKKTGMPYIVGKGGDTKGHRDVIC